MYTRLNRRLTKFEVQYPTISRDPAGAAEERFRIGVLCTLSPDELELMRDYAERRKEDPNAKPNLAQMAALENYEQRRGEFNATGKLMVHDRPVGV